MLIDNKVENNLENISNSFNNYFGTIAERIKNKIPHTNKSFSSYLNLDIASSFFYESYYGTRSSFYN